MVSQYTPAPGNALKSYRDLGVWQKSIALTKQIYLLTQRFPPQEMYGLTSQLRQASVSIPSNIAEGQSRWHSREFAHFLYIALGSLAEVDTQLVLACELGFIQKAEFEKLEPLLQELRRMLYGLINSLPSR